MKIESDSVLARLARLWRGVARRRQPTPAAPFQKIGAGGLALRPRRNPVADDVAGAAARGDTDALIRALQARREQK